MNVMNGQNVIFEDLRHHCRWEQADLLKEQGHQSWYCNTIHTLRHFAEAIGWTITMVVNSAPQFAAKNFRLDQ